MADESKEAPHGRDDQGVPLTPYGRNVDGTPRKSNRGARAGMRGNRAKTAPTQKAPTAKAKNSEADRKAMLCELSSMLLETPVVTASVVPQVRARIGAKHADALAGDAFIWNQVMPGIADGLIYYGRTNPKALAWLDKIEESGPAVIIAAAVLQGVKAVVQNHMNPNPELAKAGRSMVEMRMVAMAAAVNAQADSYRAQAEQPAPDPWENAERVDEPTRDFAGV